MKSDKEKYLETLQTALSWSNLNEYANEIMEDYEDFFNEGELQGMSEEEICNQLGNPDVVVRELLKENVSGSKVRSNARTLITGAIICMLLSAFSLVSVLSGYRYEFIYMMLAVLPVFIIILWVVLGGKNIINTDSINEQQKSNKIILLICILAVMAEYICTFIICNVWTSLYLKGSMKYQLNKTIPGTADLKYEVDLSNTYSVACFMSMLLIIILLAMVIVVMRRKSLLYFGLICPLMGTWESLFIYENMFSDIKGNIEFLSGRSQNYINNEVICIMIESIAMMLIFFAYCKIIKIKQKKINGSDLLWMHR